MNEEFARIKIEKDHLGGKCRKRGQKLIIDQTNDVKRQSAISALQFLLRLLKKLVPTFTMERWFSEVFYILVQHFLSYFQCKSLSVVLLTRQHVRWLLIEKKCHCTSNVILLQKSIFSDTHLTMKYFCSLHTAISRCPCSCRVYYTNPCVSICLSFCKNKKNCFLSFLFRNFVYFPFRCVFHDSKKGQRDTDGTLKMHPLFFPLRLLN